MARRKSPDQIVAFHTAALVNLLAFLSARDIKTVEQLNAVDGKKLLTESLYKILEAPSGKYGGDFISEGVKAVEDALGKRLSASTGRWQEDDLVARVGRPQDGRAWGDRDEYRCHHEHVIEVDKVARILLERPDELHATLGRALLGCVVLASEHNRLPSESIDWDDPWKRYRGRVRVWQRSTGKWVVDL